MKKIISLFQRNYDGDKLVRDEVVPGAEWVLAGEGVATRKYDGTAVMVRGGKLFKRYDAKQAPTAPALPGQSTPKIKAPKPVPVGFEPCQEPDPVTGHWPGWVPVGEGPEDKWHRAALAYEMGRTSLPDATYELVGPHFQGNPHKLEQDELWAHGCPFDFDVTAPVPRDYAGIREFLSTHVEEGIVFHHPDGRMVKIKAKDYGLQWPRSCGGVSEKS